MAQEPTNGHILEALIDFRDAVVSKLEQHDRRFDDHDRRFDEHDRRFDNIERRMGRLETGIEDLEGRLTAR
jgi:flavodoxin